LPSDRSFEIDFGTDNPRSEHTLLFQGCGGSLE
jgi:hypothetical protein